MSLIGLRVSEGVLVAPAMSSPTLLLKVEVSNGAISLQYIHSKALSFRLRASAYRSLESQMTANWTCYMLAWLLAVAKVAWADAQTGPYPTKPIQIITDSSTGSTPDVALRLGATAIWQISLLSPGMRACVGGPRSGAQS